MTADFSPAEGSIIEYADKGRFYLGLVTGADAKGAKYKLINALGRDVTLPARQILYILPGHLQTSLPVSNIQTELRSIELRAETLISECRIEELWELLSEDPAETALSDLISLAFETADAAHTLAMIHALREDKIYFKTIRPGEFQPRTPQIVEDLRHQADLKAEKEKWRMRFVDQAAALLAADADTRESMIDDGFVADSDVKDAWNLVENYAIFGAECQDRNESETLIEMLQNRINRGFAGTAHLRARAFLHECSIWGEDTNTALLKYGVPVRFDDAIEQAALEIYQSPTPSDGRRDLTHLNIFSIDDPETLDIDDALSVERLDGGGLRLGIHIAAPAAAIAEGSPIDLEARRRATSIYLPEQRIAMVPTILSENALSLMEGQTRAALSFLITFDSACTRISAEIVPSIVRSQHRLSYNSVEHLLEEGNDLLSDELRIIQEICEVSALTRHSRGAIDIDLPEFKLFLNRETGKYSLVQLDPSMMSRQLVAECMVMANAEAAEFCAANNLPIIYRLQPPPQNIPTPEELELLPNDLMRAYTLRRCMMPAVSSMTPGLHAGLGIEKYTQATSPLRRYADLMTHRQIEAFLMHGRPQFSTEDFNAIMAETDLGRSHAKSASIEALHSATLSYFKQLGRDTILTAIIIQYHAERSDMAQVVLVETQWRANVATKTRYPLGTMCRIRIESVNPDADYLQIKFVEAIAA